MLILISLTYADKFDYFECSVNFRQLFGWACFDSFSIFSYSKKRIKEYVSNFV